MDRACGSQHLSRHFILVEIICAHQSEAKFLSLPLKSFLENLSDLSSIKSTNNKGKMKAAPAPHHITDLKHKIIDRKYVICNMMQIKILFSDDPMHKHLQ